MRGGAMRFAYCALQAVMIRSSPRKRGPRTTRAAPWIPACAGMNGKESAHRSAACALWKRTRRKTAEIADQWGQALLRLRRERPRRHCAPEKRDELAPLHSITSSARPSNVNGKVRPSILAVSRRCGGWANIPAVLSVRKQHERRNKTGWPVGADQSLGR
jgi:hypothetical protein